jgi:hypothetical protein
MHANLRTSLHKFVSSVWFYPLLLWLVMLAAYGLYLFNLGFYWDDWQVVFLSRFKDFSVFWSYFLFDRPVSAWTYLVTVPLLGMAPLAWQVFTLLMRWAATLAFVWALNGVWPRHTWQVRWMGLLLAVFPGFSQQTISVAYSQHFITYALFTLSLGLMVWSIRRPRRFWLLMPLSLLTALAHMLTMEYFVGLELLRPFLLWFLIRTQEEKPARQVKRTLLAWLPYLGVLAVFFFYRFVLYSRFFPGPDANPPVLLIHMQSDPGGALLALAQHAIQDFLHTSLFVWANTVAPSTIELAAKTNWLSWGVGLAVAALAGWAALQAQGQDGESAAGAPAAASFAWQSGLIGVLGILLGGLPVWITDRQIIVGLWSDRFILAPMFGGVILLVWLVDWLGGSHTRQTAFLSVLLGLAIATQIRTVNRYNLYWDIQREYYWQLKWRAPALEPGTAVIGPEMPFSLVGDYSISFALNALYGGQLDSTNVAYWFIDGGRYRGSAVLADFKPDLPIKYDIRNVLFEGSTNDSIVVTYNNARGCLRVLDPIYQGVQPMSNVDLEMFDIAQTDAILDSDNAPAVPQDIFGREPAHTWCYYYQKADLARQYQDWSGVVALGNEAAGQGYQARNGGELLPFIQGYALQGDWPRAVELTGQANQLTEKMQAPLCSLWQAIEQASSPAAERQAALDKVEATLKCSAPPAADGAQ